MGRLHQVGWGDKKTANERKPTVARAGGGEKSSGLSLIEVKKNQGKINADRRQGQELKYWEDNSSSSKV